MKFRISSLTATVLLATAASAQTSDVSPTVCRLDNDVVPVDLTSSIATPEEVTKGLYPEDQLSPEQQEDLARCKRLIAECIKCAPPALSYMSFNLPVVSFKIGSAELPALLKQQLQVFGIVLRGRSGSGQAVRIDGHADASGTAEGNLVLSVKRAESVKNYLEELGVKPALLYVKGLGSSRLKNTADPTAAENRRVEIVRNLPN